MFKRNSTLIKEIILKNLRDQGLETPLLQKRLIDAWPVVMGETIASYTTSLNIRNQPSAWNSPCSVRTSSAA